jgi:hypothetical protein
MGADREIGAVVQAGGKSVAATHDMASERAGSVPGADRCANCGAAVTGKYCGECGQRVEHSVHSVWHFMLEATEDLTHADSRLWRTLSALLFKPGFLTCEFLAGRRTRYLPPIRLYLVLSLLFFVMGSLMSEGTGVLLFADTGPEVSSLRAAAELSKQPAQVRREHNERTCANLRYSGPWRTAIEPALRASCLRAVEDDGRRLLESYRHNLPRAIFLMVPVLALVMKPLYLRQRRYYVEHALFILHDHSFVFLLFGLFAVVTAPLKSSALSEPLAIAACLYLPYYYYRAMRTVYGEGPARTVGKLVVLSIAYLITATLVLIATGTYSALSQ